MSQRQAGAWWDCDVPGCGNTDLGQLDEHPNGWGFLVEESSDTSMDVCAHCMKKVWEALGVRA